MGVNGAVFMKDILNRNCHGEYINFIEYYNQYIKDKPINVMLDYFEEVTRYVLSNTIMDSRIFFDDTRTSLISIYDLILNHMVNENSMLMNYRDSYIFLQFYNMLFTVSNQFDEKAFDNLLLGTFVNSAIYNKYLVPSSDGTCKTIDPEFIGKLEMAKYYDPETLTNEEIIDVIDIVNILMEYWIIDKFDFIPTEFKIKV